MNDLSVKITFEGLVDPLYTLFTVAYAGIDTGGQRSDLDSCEGKMKYQA